MTNQNLNLPSGLFFCNGDQRLRTELANTLSDRWYGAQAHSFAAPLRDAALGAFFQGDPSIDMERYAQEQCFPDCPTTFETFQKTLLAVFKMSFGNDALGRFATRRIEENTQYFSTFIFDDANLKEDIRPVASFLGRKNCLLVNLEENGLTSETIPVLAILTELSVPSLVASLEKALTPESENVS